MPPDLILHQNIARQREYLHYKKAHKLIKIFYLMAVEDLKLGIKLDILNYLNQFIYDLAWGAFLVRLEVVAVKRGCHFVKVPSHNTSHNFSNCGHKIT